MGGHGRVSPAGSPTNRGNLLELTTKKDVFSVKTWDLVLLGLCIVLGGNSFTWNEGMFAGYFEFFTTIVLMGVAYMCLTLCLAEMASALPFSGGMYGFVRVCMNPFMGFLVAWCEALQNILFVSSSIIPLTHMVLTASGWKAGYELYLWGGFFLFVFFLLTFSAKLFWYTTRLLGIGCISILLIYILGCAQFVEFEKFGLANVPIEDYQYSGMAMMRTWPYAMWLYIGIENVLLAGSQVVDAKSKMPKALIGTMAIAFCIAIPLFAVSTSVGRDIFCVGHRLTPLNDGFMLLFNLTLEQATLFSIPLAFATSFGFIFAFGRQMASMATSGLLPPQLSYTMKHTNFPYMSVIIGCALVFIIMLPVHFYYTSFVDDLFYWCAIGSYFIYTCAFISFIQMRTKYSIIPREFINPLGITSAIIGEIIFTINLISILGFQQMGRQWVNRVHPIIGFAICLNLGVIWYWLYGSTHECFSPEEQKIMFTAYVIKCKL